MFVFLLLYFCGHIHNRQFSILRLPLDNGLIAEVVLLSDHGRIYKCTKPVLKYVAVSCNNNVLFLTVGIGKIDCIRLQY